VRGRACQHSFNVLRQIQGNGKYAASKKNAANSYFIRSILSATKAMAPALLPSLRAQEKGRKKRRVETFAKSKKPPHGFRNPRGT